MFPRRSAIIREVEAASVPPRVAGTEPRPPKHHDGRVRLDALTTKPDGSARPGLVGASPARQDSQRAGIVVSFPLPFGLALASIRLSRLI